jgi:transcriptional regulator with XRE-family HTH domain
MTNQSPFRKRIKQRCAELNITMAKASLKSGHSRQWLDSVSRGDNPRTTTIHEVAKVLGCHPSYFFANDTNQQFVTRGEEE